MKTKYFASVAFIASLILLSSCDDNIIETYSGVVRNAQHHFKPGCVYFIDTKEDIHVNRQIVLTQRHLSDHGNPTAVINIKSVVDKNHPLLAFCNKPMYIIFDENDTKTHLKIVSESNLFSANIWLLFLEKYTNLDDYFRNINIPFDCEFIVAAPLVTDGLISLTEVYRVAVDFPLQTFYFGSSRFLENFDWPNVHFYDRRNDLNGVHFKTTINEWAPLIYVIEDYSTNQTVVEGFHKDVWKIFEGHMNFTSEIKMPNDGEWGTLLENGTWDGMVGMILRNEANMTAVSLTMTGERADYISYTVPLFEHYVRVYIRQPSSETLLSNLTSPFTVPLWSAFIVSVVVLSAILALFYKVDGLRSFKDIFFHLFSAVFCQQGSTDNSQASSKRIVIFTAYLIGIIALSSYSCFFISTLTNDVYPLPFTSLNGLIDEGTYSVGMERSSWIYTEFKNARDDKQPELKVIYEKHVLPDPNNIPLTGEEGFQRVCQERYIFIIEEETQYYLDLECNIVSLPSSFAKRNVGFVFPKQSPYIGFFNSILLKLIDNGILKKLYKEALYKPLPFDGNDEISVSFKTVSPIILLGVAGVLVSILVFAVECIFQYLNLQYSY